ncbi:hypothetical protein JCM8547_007608 [Rhodosporidiobolus lusitaniae]
MVSTTETTCASCGKTASQLPSSTPRMLVCSRCQSSAKRQVTYCSRDCQVSDYPLHKPSCGVPLPTHASFTLTSNPFDAASDFQPPPALLFHLAALSGLPPPPPADAFSPAPPPPSFLYFPSTPTPKEASSTAVPPMPVPIPLASDAHRNLFNTLQLVACRTGNPLAVNLMYSLLITEVEALGGVEGRLVEQLSEEYRLVEGETVGGKARMSLRRMLEEEEEPREEDLMEAIGGEGNMGMLLEWQMAEAERQREEA